MTVFDGRSNGRTYHPGVFTVVGRCKAPDCGVPMLSGEALRQGVRREGHAYHGAYGYCRKHAARIRRHGDPSVVLKPQPSRRPTKGTPQRSRDEVLEEYAMIRDEVSSIREAAERMGMTFSALDRALYRARQDGIRAALPPQEQMDKAEAKSRPYALPRAS